MPRRDEYDTIIAELFSVGIVDRGDNTDADIVIVRDANGDEIERRDIGSWFESRIHSNFSVIADELFGEGDLTREQRIALSGGIGSALDAFRATIEEQAPELYEIDFQFTEEETAHSGDEPHNLPENVLREEDPGMPELTDEQRAALDESTRAYIDDLERQVAAAAGDEGGDDDIELAELPEVIRRRIEDAEAAATAATERAEATERRLADDIAARRDEDIARRAATIRVVTPPEGEPNLAIDILRTVDDELGERFELFLRGVDAQLAELGAWREIGGNGDGDNANDPQRRLEQIARTITSEENDRFPTFEVAYVEARKRNPDLRAAADANEKENL